MDANLIGAFGGPNPSLAVTAIICAVVAVALWIVAMIKSNYSWLSVGVACWVAACTTGIYWLVVNDDYQDGIAAKACHAILDDYQDALGTKGNHTADEAGQTLHWLLKSSDGPVRSEILAGLDERGCSQRAMSKAVERWVADRQVNQSVESETLKTLASVLEDRPS